jgi:predicted MPP superfamily phosphohydrolase
MLNRVKRISILTLLCFYTLFKVTQIWPLHALLAAALTLVFFFVMTGWLFIYHAKPELVDSLWFRLFVWLGSLAMGLWTTFILLSIPLDVGFLFYYLLGVTQLVTYHAAKITLLDHHATLVILGLSCLIALLGFIEVLRGPRVKRVIVHYPELPASLDHLKIAQLSDLHIGPTIRKNYIEKVVQRTNEAKPDIIVITGDIADAKAADIAETLGVLANLKAPYGIFYVTGNHEYYWDAEGLIDKVQACGITVLINQNRILDIKGTKIMVAGVPDVIGGKFLAGHEPDILQAVQTNQQTVFKILLAHRPEVYEAAEKAGVDLVFAGHTHGGQFFPFNILIPLAHKYYRRLNQHRQLWLHVNPGTGYWGPANRFGVPAEITLLILRSGTPE